MIEPVWSPEPDSILVKRFQTASDQRERETAFRALWARYQAEMHAICLRTLRGDRHLAQDAVQDVAAAAWRDLVSLREPERVRWWLATVARRCAVAQIPTGTAGDGHRRRVDEVLTGNPADFMAEATYGESPGDRVARTAAEHVVHRMFSRVKEVLSSDEMILFELIIRQGVHGQRLGEWLGVSGPAASRIEYKFKEKLSEMHDVSALAHEVAPRCIEVRTIVGDDEHAHHGLALGKTMARAVRAHCARCGLCSESLKTIRRDRTPFVVPIMLGLANRHRGDNGHTIAPLPVPQHDAGIERLRHQRRSGSAGAGYSQSNTWPQARPNGPSRTARETEETTSRPVPPPMAHSPNPRPLVGSGDQNRSASSDVVINGNAPAASPTVAPAHGSPFPAGGRNHDLLMPIVHDVGVYLYTIGTWICRIVINFVGWLF